MTESTTRLHISPFSADRLPSILSPSALLLAKNISFHSVQTFPENCYGFVELPPMEAEKLKKKLNGAILKGKKMKIEEAKPRKRPLPEDSPAELVAEASIESTRKSKRAKKDPMVIQGHQISPERKVRRGWTELKAEKPTKLKSDKSDRPASKYSEKEELLFQTKIPPNKARLVKETKMRKRKPALDVVHEFEKSTAQPSFLRTEGKTLASRAAAEYKDGKGWINEEGAVVEEEKSPVSRKRTASVTAVKNASRSKVPREAVIEQTAESPSSEQSGSDDSSSGSSDDEAEATAHLSPNKSVPVQPTKPSTVADETSSSGSDSDSDISNSSENLDEAVASAPTSPPVLHPLEVLFKKPSNPASSQDIVKPSLEIGTSFSFFNSGNSDFNDQDDDDDDDDADGRFRVPETPMSSQDVRSRGLRSAAPTPDTAHPSRFNSWGSVGSGDDDDDDNDVPHYDYDDKDAAAAADEADGSSRNAMKQPSTRGAQSGAGASATSAAAAAAAASSSSSSNANQQVQPSTDFEKWFWEHRGDNNRAWKKRRRDVLKENRQRENRARSRRNW